MALFFRFLAFAIIALADSGRYTNLYDERVVARNAGETPRM
jgi:hypothetical protein